MAISTLWLCLLATTSAQAAVGRTSGSFNVSANGAATYTIPIFTPPGPRGVQPSIALSYNSNSKEGYVGRGWSIAGLSSIARCNRTVAQDSYFRSIWAQEDDGFCLDGNRLRLDSGTYGASGSVYYTELADFSRITASGAANYSGGPSSGPLYWTVERKDGLIYTYGGTSDSRARDTSSFYGTLQWMVSEIRDRAGNKIKFTWKELDATTYGATHPVKIEWTQTSAGSGTYVYSMDFSYSADGNAPASTPQRYVYSHAAKDSDLLNGIAVSVSGTVRRKYVLTYESSPTTGAKRLTEVKECSDSGATDCLSPTAITYQDGPSGVNTSNPILSISGTVTEANGTYDFNGDGILDVAYSLSGTWYVRLGSASSGYGPALDTGINGYAIFGKFLRGNAHQLLVLSGGYWHIYAWNGSYFTDTNTGISASTIDSRLVVDFNGDGLDDLVSLASFESLRVSRNTSIGSSLSFASSTIYPFLVPSGTTETSLSKGGDRKGDGRQGVNILMTGSVCEWSEEYAGYYDCTPVHERGLLEFNTDQWSTGFANTNINGYFDAMLTDNDFNGDGCDDFLANDPDAGAGIGTSRCDGSWYPWGDVYSAAAYGWGVGTADWNGDANPDFFLFDGTNLQVQSVQGGGQSTLVNTGITWSYNCTFIRTDGNADGLDDIGCLEYGVGLTIYPHNGPALAADMVASIVDGYGVTHTPTYTTIEHSHYSAYNDAVFPAQDVTRGRYVVKKVTATDGIGGNYDTDYNYFGAQVNLQGRGFSGFEMIQSVDLRNGVMSEQKFKREFPYSGMPYEVNVYQSAGGSLISKHTSTMAFQTLNNTANNERYFPFVSATADEAYEVGGAKNGALIQQSSTTNGYDPWGNLSAFASTVTDKDDSSPLYNQTWTTEAWQVIFPDTTYWCLGLPSGSAIMQSSSVSGETPIYQSKGFYSPNYQYCRNAVESVGSVDTNYTYGDSFGNVTAVSVTGRNPNGSAMSPRTSSINWGTTGQFPVSETNALSQPPTTRTFDPTFGSLLTETDPNGIVVANNGYDAFGRLTNQTRPNGTTMARSYQWCTTYSACENGDPASGVTGINKTMVATVERDASSGDITVEWAHLDLFDRPIVTYLSNGGWIRTGRQYDQMGRVGRETVPCTTGCGTAYWVTNTYDLLGRPLTQSRPQSQSVTTPVTTTFGYAGRTQTITDPQGKNTTKITDANGRMRKSQDHNGYYQSFGYDAAGSLTEVTDSLSNTLFTGSYSYGIKPFLTATTDMDLGSWSYSYNSLGELVEWQDAKSQTFSQTFDALSRITSQTAPGEGTTTYYWGTSPSNHDIGRLYYVLSDSSIGESYEYDSTGRLSNRWVHNDEGSYQYSFAYNNQGALDTLTYPVSTSSTRVKVKYGYAYGMLQTVTDWTSGSAGTVYWTANSRNARGQTTQETLGNGVVTNRSFDAVTGLMNSIQSAVGGGTTLQNQSYLYDLIGNVTQRQENTQGLTENFYYDNLYRLDYSQLNSTTNLDLAYDAMGNITSKSDVNGGATWTYHSTKKHAVATTGSGGSSYSYDANGNMTSRAGSTISWSSFNYPTQLATATESTQFFYGPDRQYYKQVYSGPSGTETTHYVGGLLEKVQVGSNTDWRHSILADGQVVAIVSRSTAGNAVYYPLEDNQGSGSVLTNSSGTNLVRQSYNAFGLPRDGADWDGAVPSGDQSTINGISRRGYTGHSMLGDMGLIHMNGRVQDAVTGRFLSPDPYVQSPGFTQSFNRYAYVNNNPLSFIDPSGFCTYGVDCPLDEVIVTAPYCFAFQVYSGGLGCIDWPLFNSTVFLFPGSDGVLEGYPEEVGNTGVGNPLPQEKKPEEKKPGEKKPGEKKPQTQQQCVRAPDNRSFGAKAADAIVGFGDAFLIPIIVRNLLDIDGDIDYDSAAYRGGKIAGIVEGLVPMALEGAAAYSATAAARGAPSVLNANRYVRIGPGVGWGGTSVPRISSRFLPGDGHFSLTSRLPLIPPLGALFSAGDGCSGGN
ncbi:MAG: SpvB/TcaC N-terminal domain-containing protein [Steroidobacteraceae bacterium]